MGRTVLLDRDGLGELWLQRRQPKSSDDTITEQNDKKNLFSSLRNRLKRDKRRSEELAAEDLSVMSAVLSPLAPMVELAERMSDKAYAE